MKLEDMDVKSLEKVGAYLDHWEIEGQRLTLELNLDLLMPLVGDKFDREALTKFRGNSERAVRAAVKDGFNDTVPDFLESAKAHYRRKFADSPSPDVIDHIVDNLPSWLEDYIVSMVREYQQKTFDPLSSFLMVQEVLDKAEDYAQYLRKDYTSKN